ncbi:unnamed protein product [Penicillium palitans]
MSPSPTISSIYSRSIGSPKLDNQPVHKRTSSSVSSEPDRPQLTPADHKVGDARGFSTALESTGCRLQIAKHSTPQSDHERKESLVDELTSIQWENEFYGECTEIYEELVLVTLKVSQSLSSQSQSPSKNLEIALKECGAREIAAVDKWVNRWEPKVGDRISTAWV